MFKKEYKPYVPIEDCMDVIFIEKSVNKRHYTFDVKSKVTRKKLKALIERYFHVTVVAMASDPVPRKGKKKEHILEHGKEKKYKRLIITLRPGDSIVGILPGGGICMDSRRVTIIYKMNIRS